MVLIKFLGLYVASNWHLVLFFQNVGALRDWLDKTINDNGGDLVCQE